MSAPDSSRLDLYNGLRDALGTELADNLMAHLPTASATDLATKSDLESGIAGVRSEIAGVKDEMRYLSQRIDRLYQAMIGGFAAMVAALIASGLLD